MPPSLPHTQKFRFMWQYRCTLWRRFSTKSSLKTTITTRDRHSPALPTNSTTPPPPRDNLQAISNTVGALRPLLFRAVPPGSARARALTFLFAPPLCSRPLTWPPRLFKESETIAQASGRRRRGVFLFEGHLAYPLATF